MTATGQKHSYFHQRLKLLASPMTAIYYLPIASLVLCGLHSVLSTTSPGHLQPLGSHGIKHPVKVLDGFPTPQEFYMVYVYPSVPVVFKDGAKRSPAFSKWTDEYLLNIPESKITMVEVENLKKENRSGGAHSMSFEDFVKQYKKLDSYLVTDVPDFLGKDVLVPPPMLCDSILEHVVSTIMWFSSGGTKSVIHNDDVDNINCIFSGTKEFLFMNITKYRNQIVFDRPQGSYMTTDVESVDFDKYPQFENMEYLYTKANAGDCLYIPYKWIHQVNSIDRNIAVNLWFEHRTDISPSAASCGTHDSDLSLADTVMHELEDMDDQSLTRLVQYMIKSKDDNNENDFVEFAKTVDELHNMEWTNDALVTLNGVFQLADADEDGHLSKADVQLLKTDVERTLLIEQQLNMLRDVKLEQEAKQQLEMMKLQQNSVKEEL